MRSQFLLLWASPKGLLMWRLLSFPRMSGSVKNLQSFFRCYTSSVLYLLSLTGQPCDRLRENYIVVEISGDVTHLGSSWRLATIPINPPCQPFFMWSQFCYCEQIIWLGYTSCAAASAKSLQSCLTLCNPINSSPPGSPIPWYSPGKNTGAGWHFLLQCMRVKSENEVA